MAVAPLPPSTPPRPPSAEDAVAITGEEVAAETARGGVVAPLVLTSEPSRAVIS